jgi:hypothetical protein
VDADRARLFAIGERHEQIIQIGVGPCAAMSCLTL